MSFPLHRYFLRFPIVGTLLLVLLGVGIERLIVTDQEAIEEVGRALGRTAGTEEWGAFEALLHPDFEYEGRKRPEAVAYLRGLVRKYKPIGLEVSVFGLEVEGDRATGFGKVKANVYGKRQRTRIKVTFERGPDDAWLLLEAAGSLQGVR